MKPVNPRKYIPKQPRSVGDVIASKIAMADRLANIMPIKPYLPDGVKPMWNPAGAILLKHQLANAKPARDVNFPGLGQTENQTSTAKIALYIGLGLIAMSLLGLKFNL